MPGKVITKSRSGRSVDPLACDTVCVCVCACVRACVRGRVCVFMCVSERERERERERSFIQMHMYMHHLGQHMYRTIFTQTDMHTYINADFNTAMECCNLMRAYAHTHLRTHIIAYHKTAVHHDVDHSACTYIHTYMSAISAHT